MSQQDVMGFLDTPLAYGPGVTHVERFDTHISAVFLAGHRAFKLKRAVRFPYVDYSTLEARRTFCEKEVRLNRRTAPGLYRAVVPVTLTENGALAIGGTTSPVEWLVEMRRFEQETLLDAVARRGELGVELAAAIGVAAAKLHAAAEPRRDHGGASAMQWVVDENDAELSAAGPVLSQSRRARLHEASSDVLRQHSDLLDVRRNDGWVRECHGDLHLGNIFLAGDRPVLFDCIEFNDELSCVDVLYDMAFLIMDLLHRHLPAHANAALNAWFERLPQYEALSLLPLFLSCRAAIRSKVSITATGVTSDPTRVSRLQSDARVYLDQALRFLAPDTGAIVAIGGLSGSGKSMLARRLARDLGRAPGALVLRSDVTRKRRFGVEPTVRLPNSAYAAPINRAVYEELTRSAREVAQAGYVAIVDAVFGADVVRRELRDAASHDGVPFLGLWLEAPIDIMERRVSARGADASDANADVLRAQQTRVTAPDDWKRIDTSGTIEQVADVALASVADSIGLSIRIGGSCTPRPRSTRRTAAISA